MFSVDVIPAKHVLPPKNGPVPDWPVNSLHLTHDDQRMSSRKTFLLRMSPELYRELETWARQEMRSVNAQMEYVLADAVRRRGRSVAAELPTDREREGESQ
jgi:hypothetical protein